jgi:hypothetical protein
MEQKTYEKLEIPEVKESLRKKTFMPRIKSIIEEINKYNVVGDTLLDSEEFYKTAKSLKTKTYNLSKALDLENTTAQDAIFDRE